jgi:hypothetical protein
MKKITIFISTLLLAMLSNPIFAASAIYKVGIDKPVSAIYEGLKEALEEERMFVVFEPNIGRNISGFAEKWGDNYNRNKLSEIRSLIFCNGWFANEVSNLDPDMLALCPLSITLTEKNGNSTALFVLPSVVAGDSPAKAILKKLEDKVKAALTSAGFK